jgi:hypothetical protein
MFYCAGYTFTLSSVPTLKLYRTTRHSRAAVAEPYFLETPPAVTKLKGDEIQVRAQFRLSLPFSKAHDEMHVKVKQSNVIRCERIYCTPKYSVRGKYWKILYSNH